MNNDLQHKTALVTNATTGFGLAVARRLAQAGTIVYLHGRTLAETAQASQLIRRAVPRGLLRVAPADFANLASILALLAAVPMVDILIDNLGMEAATATPFNPVSSHLLGGVRLARHYFPRMLQQNWGRILYVSDAVGPMTDVGLAAGVSDKPTPVALSCSLLTSLARGSRVRVNSVRLSPTRHPLGEPLTTDPGFTEEIATLLTYAVG